jgi:hypothetical protein
MTVWDRAGRSHGMAGRLPLPCNEPEMRMLAMFMLAIHAMCRALAHLLPSVDIQCRARCTGMIAVVPAKSLVPILRLPLDLHSGAAISREGRENGRSPAWFETG